MEESLCVKFKLMKGLKKLNINLLFKVKESFHRKEKILSFFLVPPRIHTIPPSGSVTARQGESISLRCNATGVPIPTIAWHKSVGTVPGGHPSCGGSCYTIPYVDMQASGDYICSAVNGVGHPQHATITLSVLCKLFLRLS